MLAPRNRRQAKSFTAGSSPSVDEDRRAHHNELERRRRDHIKDHFVALKNSIPLLEGEKVSSWVPTKKAILPFLNLGPLTCHSLPTASMLLYAFTSNQYPIMSATHMRLSLRTLRLSRPPGSHLALHLCARDVHTLHLR